VILTGRTGLIALVCALPIALSPWPPSAFVVLLAGLTVAVIADVGLAASPSRLQYTRRHNSSVRLGERVSVGLLVHNGGRRRFRGKIRDAWAPSARADPPTHPVDIAAGRVQRVDTCLRPVRRGDQQSAAVTARSIGPLGLAGRQRSRPVPGHVRVLPPFLSRKHLPARLAKLREIEETLEALASPFRTAEATGQDIIDPRETRARMVEFVHDAQRVLATQVGPPPFPYLP